MRRSSEEVTILAGTERGFGRKSFVSVGIWLNALGLPPDRCALCHISMRLERIFPEQRELILTAGDGGDPGQATALSALETLIEGDVDRMLRTVSTMDGLRAAIQSGRIGREWLTKDARSNLEVSTTP
jgi:hypothetical protein